MYIAAYGARILPDSGDNAAMCGRYVSPEEAEIERFWHIGRHNSNPFARRFNVSPTSIIPILRLDRATGEIKPVKQPHFFHLPNDQLFVFAGVMAMWKPASDDEWQTSCAILTRDAVGSAAEVHDRMPVILSRDSGKAWLDANIIDAAQAMAAALQHGVTGLEHYPVSSRVNVAKNDDEDLIKAVTT